MEAVGVVVGIVVKGNKFLVERRRWDEAVDPGIVCLPAGHVEPNEGLEDALKREMLEELEIKVTRFKFVCKNFYVASNGEKQHAYCYLITDYEGKPVCKDAQEIFWEENINNLSLEVDKKTVRKMRDTRRTEKLLKQQTKLNVRENLEVEHDIALEKLAEKLKSTEVLDADAAVVVLLRSAGQDFEVLFVKRAENPTDPWSGQTALPGGKRSPEDQDLKDTVIRETLEETGINLLKGCRFLGAMEPVRSTQRPEMKIIPFVVLQNNKQKIELNDELTGYFWTSLKGLVQCKGNVRFGSKEYPAYMVGDHVVWGLTYRIVHDLLLVLSAFDGSRNPS